MRMERRDRKRDLERERSYSLGMKAVPPCSKLSPSFWHQMLEMKEAWKRQRDGSNTSTGFIVQAGALWRGTPERESPLPHTGLG
jgi:hypothetical protein